MQGVHMKCEDFLSTKRVLLPWRKGTDIIRKAPKQIESADFLL
jgi:hypothetical protein